MKLISPQCRVFIAHLIILYGLLLGTASKYHLMAEQEWSTELQRMVDDDMKIIAHQNKYIHDLEDYIGE